MKRFLRPGLALLACGWSMAVSAQTVKVAFIEGLSGPFGGVGQSLLKHFQYVAERLSGKAGGTNVTIEIVPMDSKGSPQEALALLKKATDEGIRYIVQGNGSNVAGVLIDAINKHNERNPGKEVVFLNYAAIDPDFTNSKCSPWHFRFDAGVDMKLEGLTNYIRDQKNVKNVYLINQNYSFGQQVSKFAKEMLAKKRPDIQIVGDELHPLGQVRDFAPYVAKIMAANADTVITGNWGPDLVLLVRAANAAGFKGNFYTFYAGVIGTPTAIGAAGAERVRQISYWHPNAENSQIESFYLGYRERFKGEEFYAPAFINLVRYLTTAIERAKTTDPVKVARTMAGMRLTGFSGEMTEMRAADGALQQAMYVSEWARVGAAGVRFDSEGTGFGWRTVRYLPPEASTMPTTCKMKRP
ncbi:MAG: branched-chain amino acid ABC transporter substrate-binding protein [Casimicrobiaceae bacterium]|nr:branched-chain amino acid ABC transporter substrate-binding protein [Casimicrobiaceae bacterium]MCX8098048.1 branched-chain amino acid ABC transporter substrate-binding protein [Casimicrobiaceae bacterium]MDW8312424.1 branched-chain amino acid ABC transporter substrate-binding protein [Burkholderiales bacterium]